MSLGDGRENMAASVISFGESECSAGVHLAPDQRAFQRSLSPLLPVCEQFTALRISDAKFNLR